LGKRFSIGTGTTVPVTRTRFKVGQAVRSADQRSGSRKDARLSNRDQRLCRDSDI